MSRRTLAARSRRGQRKAPPRACPAPGNHQVSAIHPPATNPYRSLVRRRFPEPLLLLLLFLLGVWLWDNHLGKPPGPMGAAERASTWELAMRKADRDLRLAEATQEFPNWTRALLGIDPMPQTLETRIAAFDELIYTRHRHDEDERLRTLADDGAFAVAVLVALHAGNEANQAPFAQLGISGPPSTEEILSRIIDGREHWWDLAYLKSLKIPEEDFATKLVEARSRHLVSNTIKARGTVLALTLGGLVFLPGALLGFLRAGRRPKKVNYTRRWKLSFGLGVFLLAYLSYLGFSISFNEGLSIIAANGSGEGGPLLSMPAYISLDALTRFLPALIALALLFRRPRHAFSRLGLSGPFRGRTVLGGFALLQLIEFGLRTVIDPTGPPDPTGGLADNEIGPWGLVFGVASACIAAPLAEEIVYRGVLFRSLDNRLPLWSAVIASSLLFALVHFYPVSSLIAVFSVGVVCALAYASSHSLLTAVVLHALYNAAIKIPEWIVYQTPLS